MCCEHYRGNYKAVLLVLVLAGGMLQSPERQYLLTLPLTVLKNWHRQQQSHVTIDKAIGN